MGAGPPYQIDDPVPVDLHHYEFYIFGSTDELRWKLIHGSGFRVQLGAIPRVQLHAILPWVPSTVEQSCLSARWHRPQRLGLTDMELGAKIAYIKESKYIPQIGTFTMLKSQR